MTVVIQRQTDQPQKKSINEIEETPQEETQDKTIHTDFSDLKLSSHDWIFTRWGSSQWNNTGSYKWQETSQLSDHSK